MNCSVRDLLDKAVGQATLEWTVLDQAPLPDVSIPGGLKEADDLTRRRESAREILNRARTARTFLRNVLDDLRLALELLLRALFENHKSLENQIPLLGGFTQKRGGSSELVNMFVKLVDYYTKYQNSYVKDDDAVIEEEVEFVFELTSAFMKHLVRLSYKGMV